MQQIIGSEKFDTNSVYLKRYSCDEYIDDRGKNIGSLYYRDTNDHLYLKIMHIPVDVYPTGIMNIRINFDVTHDEITRLYHICRWIDQFMIRYKNDILYDKMPRDITANQYDYKPLISPNNYVLASLLFTNVFKKNEGRFIPTYDKGSYDVSQTILNHRDNVSVILQFPIHMTSNEPYEYCVQVMCLQACVY